MVKCADLLLLVEAWPGNQRAMLQRMLTANGFAVTAFCGLRQAASVLTARAL